MNTIHPKDQDYPRNSVNLPAIAVIGSGYWGKNLVRNFHALGALRTVCDSNDRILATLGEQYHGVRVTTSFEETLRDSAIRGMVIATPAVHHAPMIRW